MTKEKMTRSWREINLNAIEHNIGVVRKHVKPHTMILGAVKADAYGHGATEVSKVMISSGVSMLAVAEVNEAAELRNAGIDTPILILSQMDILDMQKAVDFSVTLSVFDMSFVEEVSKYAQKTGKIVKIHIAVDTGMTRIGFNVTDESLEDVIKISKLPNIFIEGIFSHFACADTEKDDVTKLQFDRFMSFVKKIEECKITIPIKHISNSAAILRFPEYHLDMVRAGIVSYGYLPGEKELFEDVDLMPAMTVKTKITRINNVPCGTSVSYGHIYTTEKENTKIATVPIGYADGFLRTFSNKALVTAKGKTVPVIGRICMDQCMIDVTSVNNITVGDEVIIFGDGRNSIITADKMAKQMDTISYEILCLWDKRLPHVFVKDGDIW